VRAGAGPGHHPRRGDDHQRYDEAPRPLHVYESTQRSAKR
jgi:hypothetical protein